MTEQLIETFEDGVATLTMNRPEARNALTGEMGTALSAAVRRCANDPKVRAIVLTGAGGAFCAGGDVKGFAADTSRGAGADRSSGPSVEQRIAALRSGMEVVKWLHEAPKPTLAVIPGAAAGAGLSLALACDLRIAAGQRQR
ncbi:MAG: enoyl-CoA hydratase-related protein [Caulobacteraceae bacterium]